MNHPSLSVQTIIGDEQRDERNTRLHGSWLVLMRVIWVVVVVLSVGLFIVSVPFNFADSHIICATAPCNDNNHLTFSQVHELQNLGLSIDFYAIYSIVVTIIFEIGYVATGVVIFWRKSDERVALITSFYLITFGSAFQGSSLLPLHPGLHVLSLGMAFVGNVCVGFFFCLFPTGHFSPRWTRWLLVGWIVYWGYTNLVLASILTSKGLIDSVAFVGLLFLISVGFELSLQLGIIAYMLATSLLYLFLLLVPLSIGIAILRSRLFDIDVIINRTLVYGSLTILLVGLYVGLILALQALLRGLTGSLSQQPLVIVASTLVIAALFQPLRQRLQAIIDHRFFRRKYDAAKVMAAFSSTLRNEVDLDQLREQLIAVVQETMQPSHVSLWVRVPGRAEVLSPQVGEPHHEEAEGYEELAGQSV